MPKFPRPTSYTGSQSNQQQTGVARSATALEASVGVRTDVYISPATAQSATVLDFASPPVLGFGSTTPRPVNATTLSSIGTTGINTSGAGITTIGTGGTGAVNIGNATGNTAVTGNIAATGDITTTAGNVIISGAAKQLQVEGGAVTDFIGEATLVVGTVTVANTNIAANDRIFLTHGAVNASSAIGVLAYTISAGVSFTINALDDLAGVEPNDLSTVSYFIVRQL